MFWKKKKLAKNPEYFLKIGLTKERKLNIYIGWPSVDNPDFISEQLKFLLNGVMNGLFNETIKQELLGFENPILTQTVLDLSKLNKNHISPLDVL